MSHIPEESIQAEFSFDGAHRLFKYPGQCSHIHGHTYRVLVEIKPDATYGKLPQRDDAFLMDFGTLKKLVMPLIDDWDHKLLLQATDPICYAFDGNAKAELGIHELIFVPSAENMARYLAQNIASNYMHATPESFNLGWDYLISAASRKIPVGVTVTIYESPKNSATCQAFSHGERTLT